MERPEYLEQSRIALTQYLDRFTNESLRHILLNYSDTEIGRRHPELPLGVSFRDQGQFDLYAGPTRLIGNMNGTLYASAKTLSFNSNVMNFSCAGPSSFIVNGKSLTEKAHSGQLFLSSKNKKNLDGIGFIKIAGGDGQTTAPPDGGPLIDPLPASEVFELLGVFEDVILEDTPEYDSFNDFEGRLGI